MSAENEKFLVRKANTDEYETLGKTTVAVYGFRLKLAPATKKEM